MSQTSTVSQSSFVTKSQSGSHGLKPMPFWLSITLFGLPALLMLASIYRFLPWLTSLGISGVESFLTAHIVPMALLLVAAIVGLVRVDGYPFSRDSFSRRFRFPAFRFKDILWGLLIFVGLNIGYGIFSQVGTALVSNNIIPIPAGLSPWLDPRISMITQPGLELAGKWGIAALWFVMLFFNITGEELWWRGYILPRQELVHGKWTWLVHGTMWTLFHVFKWWDLIGLLPVCLIIAFAAQRLKNNWPVYIAHFLFNGMGFIFIVAQIMGS